MKPAPRMNEDVVLLLLVLAIGAGVLASDLTPGVSGPGPIAFATTMLLSLALYTLALGARRGAP